jgi:hypothetical protein
MSKTLATYVRPLGRIQFNGTALDSRPLGRTACRRRLFGPMLAGRAEGKAYVDLGPKLHASSGPNRHDIIPAVEETKDNKNTKSMIFEF